MRACCAPTLDVLHTIECVVSYSEWSDSKHSQACVAAQAEADKLYLDQDEWTRRSILYTAGSGFFSSDRTIKQYADEIWDVKPVPLPAS